jgi:hypothetical protein
MALRLPPSFALPWESLAPVWGPIFSASLAVVNLPKRPSLEPVSPSCNCPDTLAVGAFGCGYPNLIDKDDRARRCFGMHLMVSADHLPIAHIPVAVVAYQDVAKILAFWVVG